jgi:exopolysaccharide biosynthesis protein
MNVFSANSKTCLLVLVVVISMAQEVASQPAWTIVKEEISQTSHLSVRVIMRKVKRRDESQIKALIFDEKDCELRIISQTDRATAKPLSEILASTKAVGGTNGGYFQPKDLTPSGLEIALGKQTGSFIDDNSDYGSLAVSGGKGRLLWQREAGDLSRYDGLIQCSPKLVDQGRSNLGNNDANDHRAMRTFLATDGSGKWLLGVCSWIKLNELASLLATPEIFPELKIVRALNLDGGPSTGLWWKDTKGASHYDREGWHVRNIVAIHPRN